ncbi:MAG TPA: hypothetical protein VFI16_09855 [Anaeromyxobacteraceae bacterium]|nr:hypothetical protein [Anaeromyxobacteraceae bacterium]
MEPGSLGQRRRTERSVRALAFAAALGAPAAAGADLSLLDGPLRAPQAATFPSAFTPFRLLAAEAPSPASAEADPGAGTAGKPSQGPAADKPSLDFDLLGEARPPPQPFDARELRLRRAMLTVHQGIGFGLLGLQLATTVVGQLNYLDRFAGGPQTGRYRLAHQVLAYSTLGVFAVNGIIALLAPSPIKAPRKLDRIMVHRIALLVATAGMAAQAGLGIYTRERVGYLDQERLATAHLAVGYATLAAVLTGVAVLIF